MVAKLLAKEGLSKVKTPADPETGRPSSSKPPEKKGSHPGKMLAKSAKISYSVVIRIRLIGVAGMLIKLFFTTMKSVTLQMTVLVLLLPTHIAIPLL